MRVTPVADYGGSRQIRQAEFTPTATRDVLSDEQHEYTDPVPAQQAKYAADPVYNGSDALARLRGPHGG